MPTQLGTVVREYGGVLPNEFNVVTATGDLAVIAPESGIKHAISVLSLINTGTAYDSYVIRDGGDATGTEIGRIGAQEDVLGATLYFDPPIIVSGIFLDAFGAAQAASASAISHRIVENS